MTVTAIILLVVLGLIFLLLEILVIPGTGIIGIIGGILVATGIYFAYQVSSAMGHWMLGGSLLLSVAAIIWALQAKSWKGMSLNDELKERVNVLAAGTVELGDQGKSLSRINPIGKARINDHFLEVRSKGEYIDENTPIQVVKIEGNKIYVKSI